MKIPRAFAIVPIASALALAFDGDSFMTKFEKLPEPVKSTANAHMENAFPVSISSVQSGSGWNYQINTRVDGKYHDLVIDESGKLLAIKDETDLASVPAAAKEAIAKQTAAAKIVTVEKITEGPSVSYHAVAKDASGSFVQFSVGPDGSLKSNSSAK
jgi:hypothetical protein